MTVSVEDPQTGWVADDSTFGARLALIRQRMGWGNLKEAADACGLPAESWRRWERDGRAPRNIIEIGETISEATGCSLSWLLFGSKDGKPVRVTFPTARPGTPLRPADRRPPGRPRGPRRPELMRQPNAA